ncbi:sensor histidine kinase [Amycolatopsis anabasis]|uniref:sensor histidine kinase n=1 Tax=Amycolatopsis anabasis TaxID=1840409 RepID=UPI00131A68DA|nr:ATP-binding protein [Amycolatopsis anabasis]
MSERGIGAPPAGFVRALLRGGSPVFAGPSMPESATIEEIGESMLARACRYSVLGALLYRIAAFPKVLVGFLTANGAIALAPLLSTSIVAVALNVVAAGWVLRGPGIRASMIGRILAADLAIGVVITLIVAVTAPDPVQAFAVDVAWTWVVGTIALCTVTYGVPYALWLLLAAVPFRALLSWVGGIPLDDELALRRSIGCLIALVVAIVTASAFLIVVGVGGRFALLTGLRRGQQAERQRTRRIMHDSVLQTLEALGMATSKDDSRAPELLAQVRAAARAQAAELRRELTEAEPPGASASLAADLAHLAAEMARDGLHTQLVAAEIDQDYALSQARRTAMRDAVREALRNTVKHAGTKQVVLRVEERDGGIAVVARDHGQGFSTADRPPGFGIKQSIMARLAEVGGRGTVESTPGRGTRVTLWVPR